ncbi:MAG: polysaccharide deacetylase family protein [Actinomycetia bacterium]|nr:polysaccharide deacetylase family protein [Actinomycetes bacterium]
MGGSTNSDSSSPSLTTTAATADRAIANNTVYRITPQNNEDFCLEILGGSRKKNAAIQANTFWGGPGQKFLAVSVSDGVFAFESLVSGYYLSVSTDKLIQRPGSPDPDKYQLFRIDETTNAVRIYNKASGRYLSVSKKGVLSLSATAMAAANLFSLQKVALIEGGSYRFNTANNMFLGIKKFSDSEGARAALLSKNSSTSLIWKVSVAKNGIVMKLANGKSGKVLSVSGSVARDNVTATQSKDRGKKGQRFSLLPAHGGWFVLRNQLGNYLAASGQAAGASLRTTTKESSAAKFRFESSDAALVKLDARRLILAKPGAHLYLKTTVGAKNIALAQAAYSSSDSKVATVNSVGKVTAKAYGECTISVTVDGHTAKCPVSVARKWVALTFDDGPGNYTAQLLNDLKKRRVTATFFVLGSMATSRRALLRRMISEGHEIGNHTYGHNPNASTLIAQLSRTDAVVKAATGQTTTLMRPPGGSINSTTRKCGKPIVLWSVDPRDWADRNSGIVYDRVIGSTKSGSIVLLHDIHPTSTAAALRIVDTLKERGYTFVSVSELLNQPKANTVYSQGTSRPRTMKVLR